MNRLPRLPSSSPRPLRRPLGRPLGRRRLTRGLAAVAVAGLCVVSTAGATAADAAGATPASRDAKDQPVVTIVPAHLERGADPQVPFLVGHTVVDGATHVYVEGEEVRLLGRSGSDYLLVVRDSPSARRVVARVTPDGALTRLATLTDPQSAVLSDDGRRFAITTTGGRRSTFDVRYAPSGKRDVRRTFAGAFDLLDLQGGTALLGSFEAGARTWRLGDGSVRQVTSRPTLRGDLSADRLSSLTGDPYNGACAVVTSVSHPGRVLWRSCDEVAQEFSPRGTTMITVDILTDGPGPRRLHQRTVSGRELGDVQVGAYLGAVVFENESTYLVDAYGRHRGATVRAQRQTYVRASSTRPTTY